MKKMITIIAAAIMIVGFAGCSKKDNATPDPKTENPYTNLEFSNWEGIDNRTDNTVRLSFAKYPDGGFSASKPGNPNKTGQIIWKMTGENISLDLYENSNFLASFSGTYENSRLILNGVIFSKK